MKKKSTGLMSALVLMGLTGLEAAMWIAVGEVALAKLENTKKIEYVVDE